MTADDKITLTIKMEKDIKDRIEEAAKLEGETMTAWARKVLLNALPRRKDDPQGAAVVEAAFDALNKSEEEGTPLGVMPLPPAPKMEMPPPPPPGVHVVQPTDAFIGGHPCVYLLPVTTGQYTRDQCQGQCQHTNQQGRVCFWASQVSKECPLFRPKKPRIPPPSPLR